MNPGAQEEGEKGHSIELRMSDASRETLMAHLTEGEQSGGWNLRPCNPHLSLSVIREPIDDVAGLRQLVRRFAGDRAGFTVKLSALGVFPGKRPVLSLIPAAHDTLLEAHHRIVEGLELLGIQPIPHYRRDRWTPHVTIVMGRPRGEVSAAIEALSRVRWPGEYDLDAVELIEFHPAKRLERLPLGLTAS